MRKLKVGDKLKKANENNSIIYNITEVEEKYVTVEWISYNGHREITETEEKYLWHLVLIEEEEEEII